MLQLAMPKHHHRGVPSDTSKSMFIHCQAFMLDSKSQSKSMSSATVLVYFGGATLAWVLSSSSRHD